MTTPFVDQSESDYRREQEAGARFEHIKLVRREVAGSEEASEEEVARLAKDFAETMGSKCYVLADFAQERGFPDFSNRVHDLADALVAASELYADRAQPDGFVPITDEEIADLMGCSTRTLAKARAAWVMWPGHTKAIEVRGNYRNPETGESVPHRYRVHLSRLAAESTLNSRCNPKAHTDRAAAFKQEAAVTVAAAKGFVARPPKRRKAKSSDELLVADVEAVVKRLEAAASRPVVAGQAAYERLGELHKRLCEALAEFEDVHGFESGVSMQSSKEEERRVETEPAAPPDESADDPRMEAAAPNAETENCDFTRVEKVSTREKQHFFDEPPDTEPDLDLSEWVWMEGGEVQYRFPPPNKSSPELEAAIYAAVERLGGGGGVRDGTV